MGNKIKINKDVLKWAVGLSDKPIEHIMNKYPKLEFWLNGTENPTIAQIRDLSKTTHIPFGYFLLNNPIEEEIPLLEYRTIKNNENNRASRNLIDTINSIKRKQNWMRDYLIDEGYGRLDYVGSYDCDVDPKILAKNIKERLKLDNTEMIKQKDSNALFKYLRNKAEDSGIIVMQNGIVENNTFRILDIEEFRAFVLIDEYVPFIFINSNDSYSAKCFSLCHELAHIWLGKDELYNVIGYETTDITDATDTTDTSNNIEYLCNETAAELLIPADLLLLEWATANTSNTSNMDGYVDEKRYEYDEIGVEFYNAYEKVILIAEKFKISPFVVAIRAKRNYHINGKIFDFVYSKLSAEDYSERKGHKPGGGNFYRNKISRLGNKFIKTVANSAENGDTLYSDAYELLEVKGNSYDKLLGHLKEGI